MKNGPLYRFLLLVLLGMVLLAGVCAVGEGITIDHQHTGDDCAICIWIAAANNILHLFRAAAFIAAVGIVLPVFVKIIRPVPLPCLSTVRLKTRLNN